MADKFTEGANPLIAGFPPYEVEVTIVGVADILFNRFNAEEYEEKGNADKGSKIKKTDIPENRVYRDESGVICIPGVYLTNAMVKAAKYKTDPRSKRGASAMELYKAGVFASTDLAPIISATGEVCTEGWDYLDKRGACVNRGRILRARPAFFKGWKATIRLAVQLPEYIGADDLHEVISYAGRFVGVGDFRPSYGRFQITSFQVLGA